MGIEPNDITITPQTRNESRNISNLLRSVPENISLAAVYASGDPAADIVSSVRPDYTIAIGHTGTVTEARRIGAHAARTPRPLFADAHIEYSQDYFRNVENLEEYDPISGPGLSLDRFRACRKGFAYGRRLTRAPGVPAAPGSNCIIRNGRGYRSRMNASRELQNGN